MRCRLCASDELNRFTGELALHFPGLEDPNHPAVRVSPDVWVCLNCGSAEFSIPEGELFVLELRLLGAADSFSHKPPLTEPT